jgi:cytochrome P450
VQSFADELVADIAVQDEVDILDALAFPLPMEVTRMLFGVEPALWDREITALFARDRAPVPFVDAMMVLAGFLAAYIPEHRATATTDLFVALSAPDADGNVLTDLEQVANAVLLVTAGFETTMGHIANAVRTLLLHPDQLALLRADWSLARNVVDETLRFEPPALFTTRHATVDIDVAGGVIPAGSNVMFSSIAANRDPARYVDPDRFDITRTDIRPVTFGGGVHACLGAALARMETEVAVTTLFRALPELRLVEPVCATFQEANPSVRRPETLRVRVAG